MKSSNIGGQAVMEGVMMMNKDRYSVAVRRPDGEIEVKVEQHKPLTKHKGLLKVPILRGVFSFADSMIVGMSSLMYSASFYEDEEEEKKKPATKEEEEQQKAKKEKTDKLMMYGTVTFSVVIAVVLFLMVPYFLSELLHKAGAGTTLTAVSEFLDKDSTAAVVTPQPDKSKVVLDETNNEDVDKEATVDPEKTASAKTNMGAMATILILALGGVAAYYYFKIYKPKKEEDEDDQPEGLETGGLEEVPDEEESEDEDFEENEK